MLASEDIVLAVLELKRAHFISLGETESLVVLEEVSATLLRWLILKTNNASF